MPIYAYRCATCGQEKEIMQKLADAVLTTCPACGAETFAKQLTAPGLLKGGGASSQPFYGCGAPAMGGEPPPCQGGRGMCPSH